MLRDSDGSLCIAQATSAHEQDAVHLANASGIRIDVPSELRQPHSQLWLAWRNTQAVGLLLVWVVADELQIIDVATHPSHRRRGIARALLDQVIPRTTTARIALLEVRRSNAAAIALYTSCGFRQTSVRGHYYADGEDAIEMALELSASNSSPTTSRHLEA